MTKTALPALPYILVVLLALVVMHDWSVRAAAAVTSVSPSAGVNQAMVAQHLCGIYRGIVESNADPLRRSRVQVRVPQANISGLWALPGSSAGSIPTVGAAVWVMFEAGDANRPVWFGTPPA